MHNAGDTIGRYVIETYLGEGGMGRVYQAYDPALDRRVALKIVRSERGEDTLRDGTSRLLREARAAAKLDHPNAVSVFDVGEIDGTPFLAMELIHGKTLRAYVGDESVPYERRLAWLADVARALSAAHRAGIVHRDVKPDNVMVRDDGVVKVLDFGLARRARSAIDATDSGQFAAAAMLTAEGLRVGTPLYMTPEQIRGDDLDGRSDQFAWGVVAFELLTGHVPWKSKRDALGLVAAILTQPAPPLEEAAPGLVSEVGALVARCLAKSSEERYASMDEIIAALAPLTLPQSARSRGEPRRATERPPRSRREPPSRREPLSRRSSSKKEAPPLQATAGAFAATLEHRPAGTSAQSDESFRLLIERAPEGILISRQRIIRYANHALVTFLGYDSQDELVGRQALDVVAPEDRPIVAERLRNIDSSGVPAHPRKMRFLRKDGTSVSAESIGVPINFDGAPAIAAMIRPIRKTRSRSRKGRARARKSRKVEPALSPSSGRLRKTERSSRAGPRGDPG